MQTGCALVELKLTGHPKKSLMPPKDPPTQNRTDQVVQRLDDEVTLHQRYEQSRSILSKGVDYLYNRDSETFASLKKLQDEAHTAQREGKADKLSQLLPAMTAATDADSQALGRKQTIAEVGGDVVKTAFLFMPGFRRANSALMPVLGMVGTATTYGLDQAKANDTRAHQWQDFGLGAAKGVATKGLLSETPFKSTDPLLTGMALGSGSRLIDTTFTRETWSNGLDQGLKTTVSKSFTGDALKSDMGVMIGAVLVNRSLRKLTSEATERSLLWNNVSAGASYGLASGAQNELGRQDDQKEGRNWGKVLLAGISHAGLDAVAAVPGGFVAQRVTMLPHDEVKTETKSDAKSDAKPDAQPGSKAALTSGLRTEPITETAASGRPGTIGLGGPAEPFMRSLEAGSGAMIPNKRLPEVSPHAVQDVLSSAATRQPAVSAARELAVPVEVLAKIGARAPGFELPEVKAQGAGSEVRPEATKSEVAKPEVTKPEETKPEVSKPATYAVSDLLRSIDRSQSGMHSVLDYAKAMEKFPQRATSIEKVGGDTVSINLESGDILKLTTREMPATDRFFDAPVKESGSMMVDHVKVNYFVQPKGEPATEAQYYQFVRDLAAKGYWFNDPGQRNAVYYPAENRVALVDPWAVEKLPSAAVEEPVKPLNAASMSDEAAGKLASNFAPTPFTFRGKRYASFESFYQSLKVSDPKERSAIAKMTGKEAKAVGSKSHATESTYDGQTFTLGSPEHHALLQEAMLQKFVQNPEAAKALVASIPRPIIHDLGRPQPENTRLPADDFVRMLTEIREELSKMDLDNLGKKRK